MYKSALCIPKLGDRGSGGYLKGGYLRGGLSSRKEGENLNGGSLPPNFLIGGIDLYIYCSICHRNQTGLHIEGEAHEMNFGLKSNVEKGATKEHCAATTQENNAPTPLPARLSYSPSLVGHPLLYMRSLLFLLWCFPHPSRRKR